MNFETAGHYQKAFAEFGFAFTIFEGVNFIIHIETGDVRAIDKHELEELDEILAGLSELKKRIEGETS